MTATTSKIFCLIFLTLFPVLIWVVPPGRHWYLVFGAAGIWALGGRYMRRDTATGDCVVVAFLFIFLRYIIYRMGLVDLFPLDIVVVTSGLYLFVICSGRLKREALGLKIGKLSGSWVIATGYALISIVALILWFYLRGDNPYGARIPDLSSGWLVLLGIGFAAVNGACEEGVFRGILMPVFSRACGSTSGLLLQALWFGCLHYRKGFPAGYSGILLTFVFGCMMAHLVRRTRGLLLAWVVHFLADITVFTLIAMDKLSG